MNIFKDYLIIIGLAISAVCFLAFFVYLIVSLINDDL